MKKWENNIFQLVNHLQVYFFLQFLDCLSVFSEHAPRDLKIYYAFKIYDFDNDGVSFFQIFVSRSAWKFSHPFFSSSANLIFGKFWKISREMNSLLMIIRKSPRKSSKKVILTAVRKIFTHKFSPLIKKFSFRWKTFAIRVWNFA